MNGLDTLDNLRYIIIGPMVCHYTSQCRGTSLASNAPKELHVKSVQGQSTPFSQVIYLSEPIRGHSQVFICSSRVRGTGIGRAATDSVEFENRRRNRRACTGGRPNSRLRLPSYVGVLAESVRMWLDSSAC
jgi:hypothetical protein